MVNTFQLTKKYGEWAERTVYNYFKNNRKKIKIDIFYFGSQVDTVKKDKTDAPQRPDFILIETKKVKKLERKYNLNFDNPNLKRLFNLAHLSKEDGQIITKNPEYWITRVLNKEDILKEIVKNVYCMIEVKSGFGLFNKEKYEEEKINVMLPIDFRNRVRKIQKKFYIKFNTYALYVLLDKAYIANMDKMYSRDGKITEFSFERRGKSDNKKNKYRTLTFNKSYFFADVKGIVLGKRKIHLMAKPYIEIINGAIRFSLKMKPAKLKNVNIKVIKNLAY